MLSTGASGRAISRRAIHTFSLMLVVSGLSSGFVSKFVRSGRPCTNSHLLSSFDDLMDEVLGSPAGFRNLTSDTAGTTTCIQDGISQSSNTPTTTTGNSINNGWKVVDWNEEEKHIAPTPPSPVEKQIIRGRLVYFKRDDQLRLPGSQISGNKARKMLNLNFMKDFPTCLVSYGGPQSNAMLALAAVVHFQNERTNHRSPNKERKRFVYYTKKLPRFLRNQPNGNLFRALALGMELVEVSPQDYKSMFGGDFGGSPAPPQSLDPPVPGQSLWVPQGGACGLAQAGTKLLAKEIHDFWSQHGGSRPLSVLIPSGTCSTAVLVHNALKTLQATDLSTPLDIKVVAIPCVGDAGYARRQMLALNTQLRCTTEDSESIPAILPPVPDNSYFGQQARGDTGYFAFGEPNPAILDIFREMETEHQLVLDLLYGAPSWTVLLRHWRSEPTVVSEAIAPDDPIFSGRDLMYVHSGGLEGINSQLLRYKYKGLVDIEDVQLPGRRGSLSDQ